MTSTDTTRPPQTPVPAADHRRLWIGGITLARTAVIIAASGWYLMIAIGIAHHEWLHQLPTLGYGWSVLLAMLTRSALLCGLRVTGAAR